MPESADLTREPPLRFSAPKTDQDPSVVGPYRILGVLGSGGMGTVYAAEQVQPRRVVALKVIRSEYASDDSIRRFARESEVLGRLQHPGIAQIYEAGTADGPHGSQPYFAMELVRGRALTEYAAEQCRDTAQRLELFARICDAVQYAHQRGVIHRDLKPANILVDATGQPKILDFGVARLTDADVKGTRQTDVGVVVGTLQYMSPEQVAGDALEIDTRSDIYALGVILYEVLARQLPYSLERGGIMQAAHIIITRDPPSLGSIDRQFRGDVETIVAKALEKDKSRRYASAASMASDVRRFLQHEPISARPASAAYQMRKLVRRHRALFGGLAAAVVALVVGTAVSLSMAVRARAAERLAESRRGQAVASEALADRRRAEADSGRRAAEASRLAADSARGAALRERAAAVASSERAAREAAKAVAVSGFLGDMLQSTNPDLTQGREIALKDVVDRAARDLALGRLAAQPEVRADVHVTLGLTYNAAGVYDSALTHFDSAYALRRRVLGPTHPATMEAALLGAKIPVNKGDFPEGERRYRAILDVSRRMRPSPTEAIVQAMSQLALLAHHGQREAESESLGTAAIALARSARSADSVTVEALQTLAEIRTYRGRVKEAEPLWREVVELNRRRYGERHTFTLMAGYGLAHNLLLQAKYPAAEAMLAAMLPVMRAVYGDHPRVASVIDRLGTSMDRQGRREAAEPLLREALAMRLKVLEERHADVQLSRVSLGRVLQNLGRYAEAESLFTQALRVRAAVFGERHGAVASTTEDLAELAIARGDLSEAARRYRSAVAIWREARLPQWEVIAVGRLARVLTRQDSLDAAESLLADILPRQRAQLGDQHAEVSLTIQSMADIARSRGRLPAADSLYRQALDMRRRIYGPTSINLGVSLVGLARVRERMGDTASVEPLLRELVEITRAVRPAGDETLLSRQTWLGETLCATAKAAEGEATVRAVMGVVTTASPVDAGRVARTRSALAACLTAGGRYTEGEPLLLEAEAGLRGDADAAQWRVTAQRLVSLYERWGKPAEASAWRARLPR